MNVILFYVLNSSLIDKVTTQSSNTSLYVFRGKQQLSNSILSFSVVVVVIIILVWSLVQVSRSVSVVVVEWRLVRGYE